MFIARTAGNKKLPHSGKKWGGGVEMLQHVVGSLKLHWSFYVFEMKPTRCTLIVSIFISTSLHVSGNYVLCVGVWSADHTATYTKHIVARNM